MSTEHAFTFDLAIDPRSEQGYPVRAESQRGQAREWCNLNLDAPEWVSALTAIAAETAGRAELMAFGRRLAESVLTGKVRDLFRETLGAAEEVQLRLRIAPPELQTLPWELLWPDDEPLGISARCVITRFIEARTPVRLLAAPRPLRMLVIIPQGSGLNTEREKQALTEALTGMKESLQVEWLEDIVTDNRIRAALDRAETHLVHFIGHGAIRNGTFVLRLNDEFGDDYHLSAESFAGLFRARPSVRLVVLNACRGADALKGAAPLLAGQGIPAVVAMQWDISDRVAGQFARAFYRSLCAGIDAGDVNVAMGRARATLHDADRESRAFATPILFLRTDDERLWEPASGRGGRRPLPAELPDEVVDRALHVLGSLSSDDPKAHEAVDRLVERLTSGNLSRSAGPEIGRSIRLVVNQFNLSAEAVAALLGIRSAIGASLGLDPDRYRLDTLLADKTRGFVGRAHVFQAIQQFCEQQPNGYFIIEADPGLGKSALLAEYVRRTGCIAHFNVRALGIVNAPQFLESICVQLIVDFGLPYAAMPANATQDGAFLQRLLKEASAKLAPGERLVIAVDALDEVDLSTHPAGANILHLPVTMPDGVYFITTRRQVDVPFTTQAPQYLLDLMSYPAENRADVEFYLRRSADRPSLRSWIDAHGYSMDLSVATLADLSENNFMYLRHVLPEIERGAYQNLDIQQLPLGLNGYYEDHWRGMGMMARPIPRDKIVVVYILCEVRQPVSRALITRIVRHNKLPLDDLAVQAVLDEWNQFLHEQPDESATRYSIYHASFRDFLYRKDIVRAAGVTINDINALIANLLYEDLTGEGGNG